MSRRVNKRNGASSRALRRAHIRYFVPRHTRMTIYSFGAWRRPFVSLEQRYDHLA